MPRNRFERFRDGVQISGVSMNVHQKGRVFYVCNSTVSAPRGIGASDGNDGLAPERPLSTIDAAINKCTANRGDKIIVLPGHAETISDASSLVMDVAGVSVIGVGDGDLKPTISFDNTASNIPISGNNCSMKGLKLLATVDSVVAAVTVSGSGVELDLETADTSAAVEFVSCLVTTAAADNLKAKLRHRGFAAGDAMVRYVDLVGVRDAEIDVDFFGIASTSVVDMRTTACDNVRVTGTFYNDSAALTKNVTNNTTSTWSVEGYDAKAAKYFTGSDDLAVHYVGSDLTVDDTNNPIGVNDADNAFDSTNVVANRDGSVLERLEHLINPNGVGSYLYVTKSLTSSAITQAGVDVTGTSSGGALEMISCHVMTDGTGLATGTLFTLETNNTNGKAVFATEAVADLGANATETIGVGTNTMDAGSFLPIVESGKKIIAKCTGADCTGSGVVVVHMVFRRLADTATIAAA